MDPEKQTISLSQLFEDTFNDFEKLINSDDSTNDPKTQKMIVKRIKDLEELTKGVSAVDMFSRNEHHEEMDPQTMKFLLLPYMLGSLWQLNTGEQRKEVCDISQIYFKDFIKRCQNYDFIEDKEESETAENGPPRPVKPKKMTPEEKRSRKIQKLRESKELEMKIKSFRSIANEKDPDATAVREFYTSLVLKAINMVEDELESISAEMELITFAESRAKENSSGKERTEPPPPPRQPLKPFIITKDATQKKVYGMGYPSLPVMTVEELYEQRRATGEWGPPPTQGFTNPEDTGEEAEAEVQETLVEHDDETNIERQRRNDEYKDDHRRGWGNRFNRS